MPPLPPTIAEDLLGLDVTLNAVTRIVQNPCQTPWQLYFETALPAAGRATVMLFSTNVGQVIRGFARPRGTGLRTHRRRGGRPRRRGISLPELGDATGKRLPGARKARGRNVTTGVKNLWRIDNALQQGLFWWLIVDLVDEFFINWATVLETTSFCELDNPAALGGERANFGDPVTSSASRIVYPFDTVVFPFETGVQGSFGIGPSWRGPTFVALTLPIAHAGGDEGVFAQLQLRPGAAPDEVIAGSNVEFLAPNTIAALTLTVDLFAPYEVRPVLEYCREPTFGNDCVFPGNAGTISILEPGGIIMGFDQGLRSILT